MNQDVVFIPMSILRLEEAYSLYEAGYELIFDFDSCVVEAKHPHLEAVLEDED